MLKKESAVGWGFTFQPRRAHVSAQAAPGPGDANRGQKRILLRTMRKRDLGKGGKKKSPKNSFSYMQML